jgi:hypothetical protein
MRNAEFVLLLVKEKCWEMFLKKSFVYIFVQFFPHSAFRISRVRRFNKSEKKRLFHKFYLARI